MKNCLFYRSLKKSYGSALITALMLVAVVSASIILVFSLQRFFLYKTELAEQNEQALELALNAESLARSDILHYAHLNNKKLSNVKWPIMIPTIRINHGNIDISIQNIQNRYNLNQVRTDVGSFSRLIHTIDPELSINTCQTLAYNTALWQAKSSTSQDDYYKTLSPPYRSAHLLFADQSELRLIKGFDNSLYQKLSPYIIALPTRKLGKVDINTLNIPILMSLSANLSQEQAQRIIDIYHKQGGFKTINDFLDLPEVKKARLSKDRLLLKSNLFLVTSHVKYKKASVKLYHIYQIIDKDKTIKLISVSRVLFPA